MNLHKRVAALREEQHRLAELQDAEEQQLLREIDHFHAEFLAKRIKERARRLTAIEREVAGIIDYSLAESQARRDTTDDGRTA